MEVQKLNRNLFIYLSIALAFLVPFPARLAYGIVVFVEMQILMLACVSGRELFFRLGMEEVQKPLISVLMISLTLLYKFILTFLSPVMALNMGFSIFIPALCSFLLGTVFEKKSAGLGEELKKNMKLSLQVTSPFLIFFLIRDIVSYGGISLPSHNGIFIIRIIPGGLKVGVMLASIPGAFFIMGFCVAGMVLFNKYFKKSSLDSETAGDQAQDKAEATSEPSSQESLPAENIQPQEKTLEENSSYGLWNQSEVQGFSREPAPETDNGNFGFSGSNGGMNLNGGTGDAE